jgi:transcription elongation factor GreA
MLLTLKLFYFYFGDIMNALSNTIPTDIFLTEKGFANLKAMLARKQAEYAEVREHRQVAFELSGDGWHDNPEFNRQQQMEANLNHLVKTLTDRIAQAKPLTIMDGNRPIEQVAIGSVVNITRYNLNTDEELNETWEIVGFDETDVNAWQIGYNAPLAQAIYGLTVGEISEELILGNQVWEIEINQLFSYKP